jgi:hypothetical protein
VLSWTPQAFWYSTHHDFTYTLVGYKRANKDPRSWNRKEVRDLKEKFDKQLEEDPDAQIPGKKLPDEVRKRLKEYKRDRANTT